MAISYYYHYHCYHFLYPKKRDCFASVSVSVTVIGCVTGRYWWRGYRSFHLKQISTSLRSIRPTSEFLQENLSLGNRRVFFGPSRPSKSATLIHKVPRRQSVLVHWPVKLSLVTWAYVTKLKQQFHTASTFSRPPPQRPDAPTRRWAKRPGDLDLWPFDLESGVRVTCDVGYLCDNFSLPRPLCSRLRPDVRDRQTSDRQTSDRSIA